MRAPDSNAFRSVEASLSAALLEVVKRLAKAKNLTTLGLLRDWGFGGTDRLHLVQGDLSIERALRLAAKVAADGEVSPRLNELLETVLRTFEAIGTVLIDSKLPEPTSGRGEDRDSKRIDGFEDSRWRLYGTFGKDERLFLEAFDRQPLGRIEALRAHIDRYEPLSRDLRFNGIYRNTLVQFAFLQGLLATSRQPTRWRKVAGSYFRFQNTKELLLPKEDKKMEKEIRAISVGMDCVHDAARYLRMRLSNHYYRPADNGTIGGATGLEGVLWLLVNEPRYWERLTEKINEKVLAVVEASEEIERPLFIFPSWTKESSPLPSAPDPLLSARA